ncbi:protein-glutamate O-methyltransferase CheR [Geomonas sp. Red69]|uniref:Protein-glutamate O-methyltransferase CheR n=1 Tax=Geomonas diazotrophica TaxID=2843197 RepID=A0ABX8JP02_9BACT|nr:MULTISPECIES: protein-glutamate O-methyltransferase CheR [Geomonas]MBU5636381.1 protein-glutamate O-methyltransferase CheR [Geomonas diazotrophica]QWV99127.1 protein-glutamate O-methyltransferase CheR [Geomonas nitrogeniifigens]
MGETVVDILRFLTDHFGEDFHSYSQSLAEKRIAERVKQLRLPGLSEYHQFLQRDCGEPAYLSRMLRIRFSSFFRDPLQFELLRSQIMSSLLPASSQGGFLRAWSAACAGGEEPCSLAIIIDETLQMLDVHPKVQIFATDVAEDALEEGRAGYYATGSLGGVTLQQLKTYFTPDGTGYRISPKILSMISYCRHDLLDPHTYAPPESLFGGFDLICCRNFLMYLDPQAYLRVFDNLFRALNPGGVLLLGKAESVPERYHQHLVRIFECGNLYRKQQTGRT